MGSEGSKIHGQNVPGSIDIGNGVRVSRLCRNGELFDLGPDDPKTTYEAFLHGEKVSNDGPLLGTRDKETNEYVYMPYSQVSNLSNAFGSGLVNLCGLRPSNNTHVGIFSQNRWEWFVADQGCARFSIVPVPIYSTLGDEAMIHIVSQAALSLIICDTVKRAIQLAEMNLRPLRTIVVIESPDDEARERIETNVQLYTFSKVISEGLRDLLELRPAQPDDVCTISYTSGTTGVPKGVVLTHRALCLTVAACRMTVEQDGVRMGPDDVMLSYLPAAHVYERMNTILICLAGGRIGYFGGDILKLFDDVRDVAPTLFSAVPRILYKVYDKIHNEAAKSPMRAKALQWAKESKMADLKVGVLRSDTVWDSLVFQKVRDLFGGRVRHLTTGSAGVSVEVLNFFRVALSCCIYNGYGQTESGGCSSLSFAYDFRGDHVGGPIACVMIKLVDVPDLGYFAADGFGEVCVKGKNLFSEYYKMPEKTDEVLEQDGWLHTGDIGKWTLQGNLKIVDRCKMIFKLSQGEYIAPEKVEGVMQRCSYISQVFIDGKNDKDYLVAVIVPDFEVVAKSLDAELDKLDRVKLCRNFELKRSILEEIETVGRAGGLKGFELAKKVHLHPDPFTVENGLLTATLKSKRNELRKKFVEEIDELYFEE